MAWPPARRDGCRCHTRGWHGQPRHQAPVLQAPEARALGLASAGAGGPPPGMGVAAGRRAAATAIPGAGHGRPGHQAPVLQAPEARALGLAAAGTGASQQPPQQCLLWWQLAGQARARPLCRRHRRPARSHGRAPGPALPAECRHLAWRGRRPVGTAAAAIPGAGTASRGTRPRCCRHRRPGPSAWPLPVLVARHLVWAWPPAVGRLPLPYQGLGTAGRGTRPRCCRHRRPGPSAWPHQQLATAGGAGWQPARHRYRSSTAVAVAPASWHVPADGRHRPTACAGRQRRSHEAPRWGSGHTSARYRGPRWRATRPASTTSQRPRRPGQPPVPAAQGEAVASRGRG